MTDPAPQPIRFDDGAAYEQGMGVWSRLVGEVFLDWLGAPQGLRWIDVGCGSGAFTELLVKRCSPSEVEGVDPSEGQLAFARARPGIGAARFQTADAMALPFEDDRFDAAVMALVIFFVPQPARGLAEMARVVRPGGLISAYAWDIVGGGLPFEPFRDALTRRGVALPLPPSAEISREDALRALWIDGGLQAVETKVVEVHRSFEDFETFWSVNMGVGGLGEFFSRIDVALGAEIKNEVRVKLAPDRNGRIHCTAKANAVRGRVAV